jgi:hypothetical protein
MTAETTPREALAAEAPPDSGPLRSRAETILEAGRRAADALAAYIETRTDAAREVEARGGKRTARGILSLDTGAAVNATNALALALSRPSVLGGMGIETLTEVCDMAEGIADGYARDAWVLRILRIAAEAAEDARERDTAPPREPAEVAT